MANDARKDVYVTILAGGSGTRFWPKSRHLTPKQLTRIGGAERTMLELTLARLDDFVPPSRRIIVTHQDQADKTRQIAGASVAAVVAEPDARNTANALALAAFQTEAMAAADGVREPVMISLHADHLIKDVPAFLAALDHAAHAARQGWLTLIGIQPDYPETGYGYIEQGARLEGAPGTSIVKSFREKPPLAVAEDFLRRGGFLWNAGLFVWKTRTLLAELKERLPATVDGLGALARPKTGFLDADRAAFTKLYAALPKISIDNAVLEVSQKVAVVPAAIGWQDVGSWDALDRCFPADAAGNLVFGDALLIDTQGTTVDTDGAFVAAVGVKDLVVVSAGGAVLVCPKDRAQDVKLIVEKLKAQGRSSLT